MNVKSYSNVVWSILPPVMSVIILCTFEIIGRAIKLYIVNIHMPVICVINHFLKFLNFRVL
jgi:hypothetical protein